MLVLSRKIGERIHIGDDIVLTVLAVEGSRVRLGIEAPPSVAIRREELCEFDAQRRTLRARKLALELAAPAR